MGNPKNMLENVLLTLEQRVAAFYVNQGYELPLHNPALSNVPESAYIGIEGELKPETIGGVKVWHSLSTHEVVKTYELNPEDNSGVKAVAFVTSPIECLVAVELTNHLESMLDAEMIESTTSLLVTDGYNLSGLTMGVPCVLSERTVYKAVGRKVYISAYFVDGSNWTGVYEKTDELIKRLDVWSDV